MHRSRGFVCVALGMATQAAAGLIPAATQVHFLPHQSQSPLWQTGSQPVVGTVFEEHEMTGGGQGSLASSIVPESPVSVVPPVAPAPPAPPAVGSNFAFVQAAVHTNRAAKQLDHRRGYLMSQSSGATAPWRAAFCHRILRKATRVLCGTPTCLPPRQTQPRYRG